MKAGFTGTRFGMTEAQKTSFKSLAFQLGFEQFDHGDCVGSDDESAKMLHEVLPECRIVVHPPVDEELRAFNIGHETKEPKTHFARNRDIVNDTDILIATPFTNQRETRGGTWFTVDYAEKHGKTVYIIWPDGKIENLNEPTTH